MVKDYLEQIVKRKFHEVELLQQKLSDEPDHPIHKLIDAGGLPSGLFAKALQTKPLAVIAEIKRKSPSRGHLNQIQNPLDLALQYCNGGASAISVLTDNEGFGGSLFDLQHIVKTIKQRFPHVAILRKDFIVHPLQLAETAYAGAHCVLLIARVLKDKLADFIHAAMRLGLETLTEVHSEEDIEIANQARAPIIGINHRDLSSFLIDLNLSMKLKPLLHDASLSVAESGITSAHDANRMMQMGYDAVLVGEALVTAAQPERLIREMRGNGYAS